MSRHFFRHLEEDILTTRIDIGKGGVDGLIGSGEVIIEFQHFHFVGREFFKGTGNHTRQEVVVSCTRLVFTDIVIFIRATKTEKKPISGNRPSVKRLAIGRARFL